MCTYVCVCVYRCISVHKCAYSTLAQAAASPWHSLRHTLMPWHTLQHAATRCNTLQHAAIHCNTLQHTTTHRNTLQHTLSCRDRVKVGGHQLQIPELGSTHTLSRIAFNTLCHVTWFVHARVTWLVHASDMPSSYVTWCTWLHAYVCTRTSARLLAPRSAGGTRSDQQIKGKRWGGG